jgi:acyl dehydratase
METRRLDSLPALPPLYAKALAGSLPLIGGGDALPDHALEVEALEIDRDHLAAYCRVCGFGLREAVPPTYPHILGFPLSMALMSERSFPFPLLGLVHIANRIEQRHPIAAGARPSLRVWAENLRPHRRGRQLDLISEARVEGDVAWREASTYLRRGGGAGDASSAEREGLSKPDGEVAAVWRVPGDIGRRYAEVSGDRNPIHLHGLAARPFGFPGAIAHGMWMNARCLAALEGRLGDTLETSVEFRSPLRIPGRARLRLSDRDGGFAFALEGPEGERTHLVGETA